MILEGKIIGNRYEIIEKIGTGGMATVYKAKCHVLNRFVAIKILKEEFTTDEEFIKRFNTEAQAAASLSHSNIVSIYDVGQEGNLYYIVMELIQGKTLKEIIVDDGVLPWKWSLNIAIQIASALECAHKNNIVHRDIKPHNIIITEDGVAKVMDFGIAKAVSNSTITAFGTTIGSVHYFSPEQARGGYTDAKSDIYSLGVVMYEMLTGRVPFDADTAVSVALKHMQDDPVEPIKYNPSIPFAVNKIIMKAMKKEPTERYQSATEMLKDLGMALKNPEGDFVDTMEIDSQYTQVVPKITDDMLKNNKKASDNKEDDDEEEGKMSKGKKIAIAIGLIVVFIAAILGTKFALDASSPKNVDLPDLVGMTQEEAESKLKELKLEYTIEEQYNKDVESGKVISQNPEYKGENYKILSSTKIKLYVSKGVEVVKVPKIAGKTFEDAQKEIEDLGLTVEKVEETSQKIEEGVVIKQDPKEDTEVETGTSVKIYVSTGTGIKKVSVPYLVGSTESEAKSKITSAGLKAEVVYEEDTTKTDGTVLKQNTETGTTVDEGTTVIITVNKLAQMKEASIQVNVKSLLNYEQKIENGVAVEAKNVAVKIVVVSAGKEDTVLSKEVPADTKSITQKVQGVGTITVKVYIDDVLKKQTQLDLNSTKSWTAE